MVLQMREGQECNGYFGDRELREFVVEFRRVNDKLMANKLVGRRSTLNVVSAYAPQSSLHEKVKRHL